MNHHPAKWLPIYLLAPLCLPSLLTPNRVLGQGPDPRNSRPAAATAGSETPDASKVHQLIAQWPERPRLGANMMMAQYGPPQEATSENLVWHNQGPYKRIMVTRQEIPHDFPRPHMDFLEHTVDYRVPADKADELLAYDGSVTINRTAGEMSARCDLEGHNILTLNLAHDIITGKTDPRSARIAFGQNVTEDSMGKNPPYVTTLQFKPAENPKDPDQAVIPGSPKRMAQQASANGGAAGGDAEVLGFVVAIDDNEILAAAAAAKKKISPEILQYAKMLHAEHGKNLDDTLKLGLQIGVTPVETQAVDKLRKKGAVELAGMLPLNGEEFGAAYVAAMIKGHTEALAMIDSQLLKNAQHPQVQEHLKAKRATVSMHLEQAKKLQPSVPN